MVDFEWNKQYSLTGPIYIACFLQLLNSILPIDYEKYHYSSSVFFKNKEINKLQAKVLW